MRGDVFDGRGLLASAIAGNLGKVDDSKGTTKKDIDVDLELSAVMGFNGRPCAASMGKLSRRNGVITNLALSGKIGRDAPVTAALRGRGQGEREVISSPNQGCRRVPPLHRYLFQDVRGTVVVGDGPTDGRTRCQGRPDQNSRLHGEGRGRVRSSHRRRSPAELGTASTFRRRARSSSGRPAGSPFARACWPDQ